MKATITTEEQYDKVHKLFVTELERTHERSKITLTNQHGFAVFEIEAKDTASLRAAMNTITSVLGMYEKTKEATHGQDF